jgi:creatinine amidohydrolase
MIESRQLAEMTSPAVGELAGQSGPTTVVLLPVGATEPHGPHAPLATDTIISTATCERAAAGLDGDPGVRAVILPGLPYGVTRFGAAFPGAVQVAEETLHALVTDICRSLAGQGLRRVVIVNNHFEPEHVGVLRRAAGELRTEGAAVALFDLLRRRNVERLTEEFRAGECHAGRYETSIVLAERPELVDEVRMRTLPRVAVNMPVAMAAGQRDFAAMGMTEAYCGSPAEATAAEGEATLGTLTNMLVELVREVATWP